MAQIQINFENYVGPTESPISIIEIDQKHYSNFNQEVTQMSPEIFQLLQDQQK